jgi:biopolymer transport protein ExbD
MKIPNSREQANAFEIQMTPMIDMVFLLIVFFVWTSGMQAVERLLPSQISEQTGTAPSDLNDIPPPEADFDPVVVRITGEPHAPQWSVNDQPLTSLAELRSVLEKLVAIKRDAPVILHPDPLISLGHVIEVYDLSRVLGFDKVQFAADAS